MENNYADFALLFKALSDETRLKIVDMLSCGQLCACDILKSFNITQPTLSYHMKILTECGIVNGNRDGAWMHYTLNHDMADNIAQYWKLLTSSKGDCICHRNHGRPCECESERCGNI